MLVRKNNYLINLLGVKPAGLATESKFGIFVVTDESQIKNGGRKFGGTRRQNIIEWRKIELFFHETPSV